MIFGGIADDLTGAVELTGMLAAGGATAALVTQPGDIATLPDLDAIVVALRSRVAPAAEAVAAFEAAGQALLSRGARQLFFKYCATFDSTPAGNIGPCADALDKMTGRHGTLFCPTFPEPERTVYRGHHFVGDQLLSESPKRDDPLTPMTEANLVKVLQAQTATPVGLIRLQDVMAGPQAVRDAMAGLRDRGIRFAIVDAISHDDLRTIAAASVDWPLMTGGSSIAGHYPALWRQLGWTVDQAARPVARNNGAAAVLAGSCADRTREQVAIFGRDHPVLHIDIAEEANEHQLAEQAAGWVLQQDKPACVSTAAEPGIVASIQARFGRDAAANRAETILSLVARRLVQHGFSRFVVAGGETSGAVVQALGIRRLSVAAYASPGVGLCFSDDPGPLALCLKSGKLGAPDLFRTALDAMTGAP